MDSSNIIDEMERSYADRGYSQTEARRLAEQAYNIYRQAEIDLMFSQIEEEGDK